MNNTRLDIENLPDGACWEGGPEIIALSAQSRTDVLSQLAAVKNDWDLSFSKDQLVRFAADARASFSNDHPCRLVWVVDEREDWAQGISAAMENLKQNTAPWWQLKNLCYGEIPSPGKLAFAFPGQGSQYLHMGKDLVRCFPEARQSLAHANNIFYKNGNLSDFIYPSAEADQAVLEESLRSTDVAQPAIGAVSLAMMKVLQRFGVKADAACGHSFGELTALHAGGFFDEKTFLSLSAARGKFMAAAGNQGEKGGMLAVKAPMEKIETLIASAALDLVIANRNSPDQGVLSGPVDDIERMKSVCREQKIIAAILPVSGAFHSRLVASAATPFADQVAAASFSRPTLPVYSNTTALPYPEAEAKVLLCGHLMNSVNFTAEIENMHQDGIRIFIEVGPRTVLTGLIKSILKDRGIYAVAVDGSAGKQSGLKDLALVLAMLGAMGWPVRLSLWKSTEI